MFKTDQYKTIDLAGPRVFGKKIEIIEKKNLGNSIDVWDIRITKEKAKEIWIPINEEKLYVIIDDPAIIFLNNQTAYSICIPSFVSQEIVGITCVPIQGTLVTYRVPNPKFIIEVMFFLMTFISLISLIKLLLSTQKKKGWIYKWNFKKIVLKF